MMLINMMGILSQKIRSALSYQTINFASSSVDYINLGNTIANGCRTIELWYKPAININSGSPITSIISRYVTNLNDRLDIAFDGGKIFFQVRNSSGAFLATISSDSNTWKAGVWYHIACKISASGTKMYIDTVLQASQSANTTPIPTSTKTLYLGGMHGLGIRYINGAIRNVQFWSISRDASEIAIDKDTYYPAGTPGLIESYHFTDEFGFTVSGVNGNNGTINTSNVGGVTYVNSTMREIT